MTYAISTTSFAALCSLIWLVSGGTFLSALALYLFSGQVAMIAMIARAAFSLRAARRAD